MRRRVMTETTVLDFLHMMATCGLIGEDNPSPNRSLVIQSQKELKEVTLQLYSGAISTEAFLQTAPFPYSLQNSSTNMYWLFIDCVMDALARVLACQCPEANPSGVLQCTPHDATAHTGSKLHTFCGELWCRYMQHCVGVWRIAYASSKFSLPHFNFAVPVDITAPTLLLTVPYVDASASASAPASTQVVPQTPPATATGPRARRATPPSTVQIANRAGLVSLADNGRRPIPADWGEIMSIGGAVELQRLKHSFQSIKLRVKGLQD